MKRIWATTAIVAGSIALAGFAVAAGLYVRVERAERSRFANDETELKVANLTGDTVHLFRSGGSLMRAAERVDFKAEGTFLRRGNYFLEVDHDCGETGSIAITARKPRNMRKEERNIRNAGWVERAASFAIAVEADVSNFCRQIQASFRMFRGFSSSCYTFPNQHSLCAAFANARLVPIEALFASMRRKP